MNENSILISYYHVGVINHKLHCLNSASYCILQNDEAALLEGEKEAEMMIVEAYAALLLAFLSTERCLFFLSFLFSIRVEFTEINNLFIIIHINSMSTRAVIAECLPNHNLGILVPVLERFVVCTL